MMNRIVNDFTGGTGPFAQMIEDMLHGRRDVYIPWKYARFLYVKDESAIRENIYIIRRAEDVLREPQQWGREAVENARQLLLTGRHNLSMLLNEVFGSPKNVKLNPKTGRMSFSRRYTRFLEERAAGHVSAEAMPPGAETSMVGSLADLYKNVTGQTMPETAPVLTARQKRERDRKIELAKRYGIPYNKHTGEFLPQHPPLTLQQKRERQALRRAEEERIKAERAYARYLANKEQLFRAWPQYAALEEATNIDLRGRIPREVADEFVHRYSPDAAFESPRDPSAAIGTLTRLKSMLDRVLDGEQLRGHGGALEDEIYLNAAKPSKRSKRWQFYRALRNALQERIDAYNTRHRAAWDAEARKRQEDLLRRQEEEARQQARLVELARREAEEARERALAWPTGSIYRGDRRVRDASRAREANFASYRELLGTEGDGVLYMRTPRKYEITRIIKDAVGNDEVPAINETVWHGVTTDNRGNIQPNETLRANYTPENEAAILNLLNNYRESIQDRSARILFSIPGNQIMLDVEQRVALESATLGMLLRALMRGMNGISAREKEFLMSVLFDDGPNIRAFRDILIGDSSAWGRGATPVGQFAPPSNSFQWFELGRALNLQNDDLERLMRAFNNEPLQSYVYQFGSKPEYKTDPLGEYRYVTPADADGNVYSGEASPHEGHNSVYLLEHQGDAETVRQYLAREGANREKQPWYDSTNNMATERIFGGFLTSDYAYDYREGHTVRRPAVDAEWVNSDSLAPEQRVLVTPEMDTARAQARARLRQEALDAEFMPWQNDLLRMVDDANAEIANRMTEPASTIDEHFLAIDQLERDYRAWVNRWNRMFEKDSRYLAKHYPDLWRFEPDRPDMNYRRFTTPGDLADGGSWIDYGAINPKKPNTSAFAQWSRSVDGFVSGNAQAISYTPMKRSGVDPVVSIKPIDDSDPFYARLARDARRQGVTVETIINRLSAEQESKMRDRMFTRGFELTLTEHLDPLTLQDSLAEAYRYGGDEWKSMLRKGYEKNPEANAMADLYLMAKEQLGEILAPYVNGYPEALRLTPEENARLERLNDLGVSGFALDVSTVDRIIRETRSAGAVPFLNRFSDEFTVDKYVNTLLNNFENEDMIFADVLNNIDRSIC